MLCFTLIVGAIGLSLLIKYFNILEIEVKPITKLFKLFNHSQIELIKTISNSFLQTVNFNIFTLFFVGLFILHVCIILFYTIRFMSTNLILKTVFNKIFTIAIYMLLVSLIFSIFIWRILNLNKEIYLNKNLLEKTYSYYLDFLENYELFGCNKVLFFCICFLSIVLSYFLFVIILIYLRSQAYCGHVYLLQFKWYSSLLEFLWSNLRGYIQEISDSYYLNNYASNKWFRRALCNIIVRYSIIYPWIANVIIFCVPLTLLIYDLYFYSMLSKFYFCLPWIYLLIIFRMCNNLLRSTFCSDTVISENLYKDKIYSKYIIYCLTLKVNKKKKYKKRNNIFFD